ncbi:MAG: protein-L-isoaspartate(D-aspartate) O-methyltransferase [Sulfuriflexus sp.]|nr:protein-L-isoaspartate(D-aspartate) O-methyltransferase [Sulfuriflexus sp.]
MTSQRTRDRLIDRLRDKNIQNESVLEVMRSTPRHIFVDEAMATRAYEDTALPIGLGQTISQPYIVARMTEALLDGGPLEKVLEIGTGSGYQTALLSRLVKRVYSVERIEALQQQARLRFQELGLRNIRLKHSDGNWGWDDYAPYDGIIVTAAPAKVPKPLFDQLKVGGRLVIPVGEQEGSQNLLVVTRTEEGFDSKTLDLVSFVPLLGGRG